MCRYTMVIVGFFMVSCCGLHTEITYEHKGIVVTRIDECGITSFYYKNSQNESAGKIWVEYSGINDGFDGYIKFDSTKIVTILAGDGYFKSEGLDTTLFRLSSFKSYERPIISQAICYISLSIRHEKEDNDKAKSGVKAEYKIDKNEWW